MQIEQDEIGPMLTGKIETDLALHGRHELDVRLRFQDLLDQSYVRKIVLDIKNRAPLRIRYRLNLLEGGRATTRQAFHGRGGPRQLHPEDTSPSNDAVGADGAAH